jgi:hypothetical protein
MRKAATAAVTAACFFVVTSFAALAASAFEQYLSVSLP